MASWEARNAAFVEEHNLTSRDRQVPDPEVALQMEAGEVYAMADWPSVQIAEGVKASVCWGRGTLLEWLEMAPGTEYPAQVMTGEMICAVQSGSGTCCLDGQEIELSGDSLLYLTEGMERSLRAGPGGLVAMEVFSPVRLDHLALAGTALPGGSDVSFPDLGVEEASLEPGRLYSFDAMPRIPIRLPGEDPSVKPSADTTLMWGKNFMLSFISMAPGFQAPNHWHPEDQLMLVMRGAMKEGIIGEWRSMAPKDVILQPGGMVHSALVSPEGVSVVDLFWPGRPDYMELVK